MSVITPPDADIIPDQSIPWTSATTSSAGSHVITP
jgi:hypothetical protein